MTNAQIATLLRKNYTPAHISTFGQCGKNQVDHVRGLIAFAWLTGTPRGPVCIYAGNDVYAADDAARDYTEDNPGVVTVTENGVSLTKWLGGKCYA